MEELKSRTCMVKPQASMQQGKANHGMVEKRADLDYRLHQHLLHAVGLPT